MRTLFKATTLLALMAATPLAAMDGVVPIAANISTLSAPSIASHDDATVCSWVNIDSDGRARIMSADLSRQLSATSYFFPMRVVDQTTSGDNLHPQVTFNPSTERANFLWVNADGTTSKLMFRADAQTETIRESEALVESLTLTALDDGRVVAAWTEVSGHTSTIYAAIRQGDGDWKSGPISVGDRPFDVMPQLVTQGDLTTLFFYRFEGESFKAVPVSLTPERGEADLSLLDFLPQGRLASLYATEEGSLGALWLEATDKGESFFRMTSGPDETVSVTPVGNPDETTYDVALARGANPSLAWFQGTPVGEGIVSMVNGNDSKVETARISPVASNPALSTGKNWNHLVWQKQDLTIGTTELIYRRFAK